MDWSMFTPIDIFFAVLILVVGIRSAFRGFIQELMSLAAIVIGLLGAWLLYRPGALLISQFMEKSPWMEVIAFLVIFLVFYLVIKLMESAMHKLVEAVNLHNLDKSAGFLLGLVEGLIIVGIIIFLIDFQPFFDLSGLTEGSFAAKVFYVLTPLEKGVPLDGVPATQPLTEAGNV